MVLNRSVSLVKLSKFTPMKNAPRPSISVARLGLAASILDFSAIPVLLNSLQPYEQVELKPGILFHIFCTCINLLLSPPVYLTTDAELLNGGQFLLVAGNTTGGVVTANTVQTGGDSRGFMQVQKIWNNIPGFNSTCSYGCNEFNSTGMALRSSVDAANPNLATDIAGRGAFFMGVNLESLTSETDLFRTTTAVAGYNVQFRYWFQSGYVFNQNVVVSIFLWVEGDLVIENGVANVDL